MKLTSIRPDWGTRPGDACAAMCCVSDIFSCERRTHTGHELHSSTPGKLLSGGHKATEQMQETLNMQISTFNKYSSCNNKNAPVGIETGVRGSKIHNTEAKGGLI